MMKKMCEFARARYRGSGKNPSTLTSSPRYAACDCYGHADAPIVNDIGICASTDRLRWTRPAPILVNAAPGNRDTALKSGFEPVGTSSAGCRPTSTGSPVAAR